MDIRVEPISSPQRCHLNLTTNPPYILKDKKQLEGFTRMIKAITTMNCKEYLKTSELPYRTSCFIYKRCVNFTGNA